MREIYLVMEMRDVVVAGFTNFSAATAAFGCTLVNCVVDCPSTQVIADAKGHLDRTDQAIIRIVDVQWSYAHYGVEQARLAHEQPRRFVEIKLYVVPPAAVPSTT